jgi:hypothetical protein
MNFNDTAPGPNTRFHAYTTNTDGDTVSVLDTTDGHDAGFMVWNHEHGVLIGVANTLDDADNMING